MYNKHVVLIVGYSKGGTNILWNILQSHPKITAPANETGPILSYNRHLKFGRLYARLKKLKLADNFVARRLVDFQLYNYKLRTIRRDENRYKSEFEIYSKNEVKKSTLCLKSVDDDIFLTEDLLRIYPEMHIICLTRNGYALLNGHKRRGNSIHNVANLYCRVGEKMKEVSERHHNVTFVKFEDILEDPFKVSETLYTFMSLEPTSLKKLRFKSKKILGRNSNHIIKFGKEAQKYWIDKTELPQVIDASINDRQIAELSESDISKFNRIAACQLRDFGYEVL
jgi:hypothetical protein